jgi:rRNA small subunit pseudouridine methyltransferase Nep1
MLNLVFTEASIELVPSNISTHPSVKRNAKRRKKQPEETLLERSLHHYAMDRIPDSNKRGRPDILHFCLLISMGSPLNHFGKLKVSINTLNNYSISVNPTLRPPRDCLRFNRLIEQLLVKGLVKTKSDQILMELKKENFKEQLNRISPSLIIALSSHGKPSTFETVANRLAQEKKPAVLIGAYPHGPMNPAILNLANDVCSVSSKSLEAWTITSRIIYEYEKAISI